MSNDNAAIEYQFIAKYIAYINLMWRYSVVANNMAVIVDRLSSFPFDADGRVAMPSTVKLRLMLFRLGNILHRNWWFVVAMCACFFTKHPYESLVQSIRRKRLLMPRVLYCHIY